MIKVRLRMVPPCSLGQVPQQGWKSGPTVQVQPRPPQFGNNISHAHNVTRRRWNPNLQSVKALMNGASKRVRVCTSCIKAGKIVKG
jgi:large subunit ribosomal protein L28